MADLRVETTRKEVIIDLSDEDFDSLIKAIYARENEIYSLLMHADIDSEEESSLFNERARVQYLRSLFQAHRSTRR